MSLSQNSPRRAEAQLRRLEILKKRAKGLTLQEIADEEGVTKVRIHQILKRAFEELKEDEKELVKHMRRESLVRINLLRRSVWDKALGGDIEAVKTALKVEERLTRLYGLDKPTRQRLDIHEVDKMTPAEIIEEAKRLGLPVPQELEGLTDADVVRDQPGEGCPFPEVDDVQD